MAGPPAMAARAGAVSSSSSSISSSTSTPSSSSSSSLFSQPTRWLRSYDDFIARNLGQVSQIESALRSLTYVIPGRFRDAEIASETIHTGVQLLSLYHDMLLLRTPKVTTSKMSSSPSSSSSSSSSSPSSSVSRPPGPSPPPPSQHTRYTRYWIEKSPFYRRVAVVLRVVRYTELLCEMAAKRRGERLRWRVVVLIEAVKAICRLLLLRVTRGRTLLRPTMPVRQPLTEAGEEEDEEEEEEADRLEEEELNSERRLSEEKAATAAASTASLPPAISQTQLSPQPPLSPPPSPSPAKARTAVVPHSAPLSAPPPSPPPSSSSFSTPESQHSKAWAMPRTGMALPPLPLPGNISAYLQGRVLTADDIKAAPRLLNRLRGSGYAAEVLHILAPVVFAAALAHSNINGKKRGVGSGGGSGSSKLAAWTPWLAGLAMECAARQLRDYDNNGLRTTTLEHDEWTRRGWAMGWWSMRGAFYEHAMKGVVAGVRARVPSFVGGILEDYEYLWENYYFSTSP